MVSFQSSFQKGILFFLILCIAVLFLSQLMSLFNLKSFSFKCILLACNINFFLFGLLSMFRDTGVKFSSIFVSFCSFFLNIILPSYFYCVPCCRNTLTAFYCYLYHFLFFIVFIVDKKKILIDSVLAITIINKTQRQQNVVLL